VESIRSQYDSFHLEPHWSEILIFFFSPKIVQISHLWRIFQNLKFKGQKIVPRRRFAKMCRVSHGPVMAAGGPGSVPAAKYKTYNSFYRSPYRLFVCMFHVLTHLTMQHQLCGFSARRQACRQRQRQYRQNLGRVDWRMPFDTQRPL